MKKTKLLLLVGVLSCSMFLFACGQKDNAGNNAAPANNAAVNAENNKEEAEAEAQDDKVSLADWEGEWNNMGGYLERPEVQPAYEELAKKENVDVAKAKADYLAKRQCDFDGLKIEGDKITYLSTFPEDKGQAKGEGTYKFVESKEVPHGNATLEWDIFEAEGDAPYKYLLMMPVHGEEALTHFHMRYGDDKDELLAKEGWFPTFVKPSSTNDQIIGEIAE